eukprot:360136-Chlamydomonas_euryale.AAC.1
MGGWGGKKRGRTGGIEEVSCNGGWVEEVEEGESGGGGTWRGRKSCLHPGFGTASLPRTGRVHAVGKVGGGVVVLGLASVGLSPTYFPYRTFRKRPVRGSRP